MIFSILPIVWGIASIYEGFFFPNLKRKNRMILAAFLSVWGSLCAGPSKLIKLPDWLGIIIFSQVLHGLIDPFLLIPALPEMIDSASEKFPQSNINDINDVSSGLFNMFLGIGQICGPIISSSITKNFGFKTSCDTVAVISFIFGIIYFMFTRSK